MRRTYLRAFIRSLAPAEKLPAGEESRARTRETDRKRGSASSPSVRFSLAVAMPRRRNLRGAYVLYSLLQTSTSAEGSAPCERMFA